MLDKIKQFFRNYKTYQWIISIIITLFLCIISVYYFNSYRTSKVYDVDFADVTITHEDGVNAIELMGISLPKGNYVLGYGYVANTPGEFYALIDNENSISELMDSTYGGIVGRTKAFELKAGTDRGMIRVTSDDNDPVALAYITITSDRHIYTDGLIWGILALLLIPCMWIAVYFYGNSTHKVSLLVVIGLVIIQTLPFILTKGLLQGIDTRAHMMRIEGIYYGIMDGQYTVIVQPEWNNSYGQIGVLYPNVFLYIPALFRCMRMSQLGVCKLFLFLIVGSGGIIAYAASRTIFKRDWQVALCSFAIMIDNMRIHDLMNGGRIGGSLLAEMFWPLLVAGLIELFYRNRNKWYLLAFGIAGTFCCHVTSASVACIFILIMTAFSIKKIKEVPVQKGIGRAILLFMGLTLGTLCCFIQFYFGDWGQETLQWTDFRESLWSIRAPFIDGRFTSVIAVMLVCLGIIIVIRIKDGKDIIRKLLQESYVFQIFASATILLWMATSYFPWDVLMNIPGVEYYTNMLQSGYRFLSLSACAYAFCLPELLELCVHHVEGRRSYESRTVIVTSILIVALAGINFITENQRYMLNDELVMLYKDEVVGSVEYNFEDYLPAGTKTEWYESDTGFISDETAVQSLAYEREGTYVYYSYSSATEGNYVEFPKFYYNGYVAKDEMGDDIDVYKGDKNRVRIYLAKSDTPKIVRLWYHVPWYLTFTCAISMGLWLASIILLNGRVFKKID